MFSENIIWMLVSFFGVAVLTPLAVSIAKRFDFVDKPGGRKCHENCVPPVGGIVIFSVFIAISFIIGMGFKDSWAFFLALGLILATGIIDDKQEVPAAAKFFIHFLSAFIIVVPGHAQLATLGDIFGAGEIMLGAATIPFTIACVVYIINAVNMMDGVDGLAGGQSLIIVLYFLAAVAVSGGMTGQPFWSLVVLASAIAGFLIYNMRHPFREKASIFLGDAGSMALGITIAWFSIHLSQGQYKLIAPISIAWIIALPIIDAFGLLVARLKAGKHPFAPDRRHFHHHFLEAGFTPGQAACLILGWSAILGAIGFVGFEMGVPQAALGWGWIALWLCHALLVMKPQGFIRLLARIHSR